MEDVEGHMAEVVEDLEGEPAVLMEVVEQDICNLQLMALIRLELKEFQKIVKVLV